jgi:hypothetical protein
MPSREKKDRTSRESKDSAQPSGDRARPGTPDEESVLEEREFTSPKGKRYRIIRTDETDPYDGPLSPEERRRGEGNDP